MKEDLQDWQRKQDLIPDGRFAIELDGRIMTGTYRFLIYGEEGASGRTLKLLVEDDPRLPRGKHIAKHKNHSSNPIVPEHDPFFPEYGVTHQMIADSWISWWENHLDKYPDDNVDAERAFENLSKELQDIILKTLRFGSKWYHPLALFLTRKIR